jgi:AraC-like DNA-binding protein
MGILIVIKYGMHPFSLLVLLAVITFQATAGFADFRCPEYMGKLYARGIRSYWTGTQKDFGETVFGPLTERDFDHESITQLEDSILHNYSDHPPSGEAKSLGKTLRTSEQNAQMILSFYDLSNTIGADTSTGYDAYTRTLSHVRARTLAPVTLYLKQNQTKKDITELTQDLRKLLKNPLLSEGQVYQLMWLSNLEMEKAWAQSVSPSLLSDIERKLGQRPLPTTVGALAAHLYGVQKWSRAKIAQELGISETSLTHHFHATGVVSNTAPWSGKQNALLKSLYGFAPAREIAELLGRTEASVRGQAGTLNLTEEKDHNPRDLYLDVNGNPTTDETQLALKIGGALQAESLAEFLRKHYQQGFGLAEVAKRLEVSITTLGHWNTKLGLYPRNRRSKNVKFHLAEYLSKKPKPGQVIFEAFLAGDNTLPKQGEGKGDPGKKLSKALTKRIPAQDLINQIPVDLRQQHAEKVEQFRKQYQARLDSPLVDRSIAPGHAFFEAFLAGGNALPKFVGGKGDPGMKLSSALNKRKPAHVLIDDIPKYLREQNPMAVEEFRKQYQARLDVALLDRSKAPGHAIFKAFLDGGKKLPRRMGGKGDPGTKLASVIKRRKPAQYLIGQIPVDLRQQNAEEVEEFRKQYQARLTTPLIDRSIAPGHAIFEAFLAGDNALPKQGRGKGNPGNKLNSALQIRKPAHVLIDEIPLELRQQHPHEVEEFRRQYQARLDVPLRDDSKAPGHAIFEAYLAGGTLPKQGKGKGDPGKKLSKALTRRIPAQDLINQIPKDLSEPKPEAVEAFRLEYELRLRSLPEKDP